MAEPAIARDLLPEDAYDGHDPYPERLAVLERVVASVLEDPDPESRALRMALTLRWLDNLGAEALAFVDRVTNARVRLGGG
jgi:hypothetical protein